MTKVVGGVAACLVVMLAIFLAQLAVGLARLADRPAGADAARPIPQLDRPYSSPYSNGGRP